MRLLLTQQWYSCSLSSQQTELLRSTIKKKTCPSNRQVASTVVYKIYFELIFSGSEDYYNLYPLWDWHPGAGNWMWSFQSTNELQLLHWPYEHIFLHNTLLTDHHVQYNGRAAARPGLFQLFSQYHLFLRLPPGPIDKIHSSVTSWIGIKTCRKCYSFNHLCHYKETPKFWVLSRQA